MHGSPFNNRNETIPFSCSLFISLASLIRYSQWLFIVEQCVCVFVVGIVIVVADFQILLFYFFSLQFLMHFLPSISASTLVQTASEVEAVEIIEFIGQIF